MFIGFFQFYSTGYYENDPALPMTPMFVYLTLLAVAFVTYIISDFRKTEPVERLYGFQMFGAFEALVFYLSIAYFYVIQPRSFFGPEDGPPPLSKAFCYGYWLSVTATVYMIVGALRKVRRIVDEDAERRSSRRRRRHLRR